MCNSWSLALRQMADHFSVSSASQYSSLPLLLTVPFVLTPVITSVLFPVLSHFSLVKTATHPLSSSHLTGATISPTGDILAAIFSAIKR